MGCASSSADKYAAEAPKSPTRAGSALCPNLEQTSKDGHATRTDSYGREARDHNCISYRSKGQQFTAPPSFRSFCPRCQIAGRRVCCCVHGRSALRFECDLPFFFFLAPETPESSSSDSVSTSSRRRMVDRSADWAEAPAAKVRCYVHFWQLFYLRSIQ